MLRVYKTPWIIMNQMSTENKVFKTFIQRFNLGSIGLCFNVPSLLLHKYIDIIFKRQESYFLNYCILIANLSQLFSSPTMSFKICKFFFLSAYKTSAETFSTTM